MTLIGISIGLGLLLLVLACRIAFAQTAAVKVFRWDLRELETVIETFATLTEGSGDAYLLRVLSREEYIRCRRTRAILARKCLRHIAASASLAATIKLTSDTEEIRSVQSELTKAVANVRIAVSLASTYLFLIWLVPRWMSPLQSRARTYQEFLWRARVLQESEQRT